MEENNTQQENDRLYKLIQKFPKASIATGFFYTTLMPLASIISVDTYHSIKKMNGNPASSRAKKLSLAAAVAFTLGIGGYNVVSTQNEIVTSNQSESLYHSSEPSMDITTTVDSKYKMGVSEYFVAFTMPIMHRLSKTTEGVGLPRKYVSIEFAVRGGKCSIDSPLYIPHFGENNIDFKPEDLLVEVNDDNFSEIDVRKNCIDAYHLSNADSDFATLMNDYFPLPKS
jgi:hypothetical protein